MHTSYQVNEGFGADRPEDTLASVKVGNPEGDSTKTEVTLALPYNSTYSVQDWVVKICVTGDWEREGLQKAFQFVANALAKAR